MVNFFNINQKFILADLPGYGFSVAAPDVKRRWQPLIENYLKRPRISALVCLADSRRTPNQEDLDLWQHLASQHTLIFVITKIDKLNQSERAKSKRAFKKLLSKKTSINFPYSIRHLEKNGCRRT